MMTKRTLERSGDRPRATTSEAEYLEQEFYVNSALEKIDTGHFDLQPAELRALARELSILQHAYGDLRSIATDARRDLAAIRESVR